MSVKTLFRYSLFVLFALLSSHTTASTTQARIRSFPFKAYRFEVTYQPGGRTISGVVKSRPGVIAFPAGYFAPDNKPIVNVDFTMVKGKVVCKYYAKGRRPVLAFSSLGARIIRPDKNGAIWLRKDEVYAVAGDKRPTYPREPKRRHLVAVNKWGLTDIMVTGTERDCRRFMKAKGYSNYLYLDGGSTCNPQKLVPSHYLVARR